ncbi:TIGR02391 family protein [Pseudarthrobacter oxydans]|uniref:TIGR02391 family protein n=1 Tax=Pseudarthrobacter oxydans TaxID=1671 RepID=UPI001571EE65|nr:TIGR02391 family protein [Pseudarthrobacter oxydans]NSX36517.1 TIGR02391 family protein [Pseudarthrobacter oxydans]
MYRPLIPFEDVRNLPLPDLALKLLAKLDTGTVTANNTFRGFDAAMRDDQQPDRQVLLNRLSDAWAWLESHGLLGPDTQAASNWQRVTASGCELINDPKAISKVWAADRLAGALDPLLSSARSNFALGDYETACFAALKAVEVEVRRVASLPDETIGVHLMRKAFNTKDGLLTDTAAEGGEKEATANLFAGAIGAYKNPTSHRTVQFDDPMEAVEVIQLADLLLRIVHRAEKRLAP